MPNSLRRRNLRSRIAPMRTREVPHEAKVFMRTHTNGVELLQLGSIE
jgi:hypothetical protein